MTLCLDVGNTQMHGGVFDNDELVFQFRKQSSRQSSSDELGLFLRSVLRENQVDPDNIKNISICSVVPEVLHSLKNCCLKYFLKSPFILQAGTKTGLQIKYRNPLEVGADRIANAIAASQIFAKKNIIVVDFGTATTFCAINKEKSYLGGTILPGVRISMEALENKTSKLPSVEILVPESCLGRSTVESIQAGLFYSHMGAIKEILQQLTQECFSGEKPVVVATGGFASLFEKAFEKKIIKEKLFDTEVPDLVLQGLYLALKMNL